MFHHRLVFGAALLSCCTGESLVNGPTETVLAFAGGDVILPCGFDINANDDFPTVEWSKEGLESNVIFLYRDGCETYEMKNPAFEYRTSLITKELKNGNISLRISNVQLSDTGKYQCMRLWNNPNTRDITTLELVVGAASEPKLSIVSAESGEVTLQCEANCWQPEPEITFLDDQGNNISAEDPKRDQNTSGCYTVRRRVTLQTATNRVTCRVHQPNISQTRDTVISIPAGCLRSFTLITVVAVGASILPLLGCGIAVFIWRRCRKSAEGRKLPVARQASDESTMSDAESQLLPKQKDIEDQLRREVADLKSKLCEKDKIILKLQNDRKSRLSTVVCQHTQPTIFCSPSKSSLEPKAFSPPSDLSPKAINLPTDHNPKPTASTDSNPPSVNLPQSKGAKRDISRQDSIPAHGRPIQRKYRKNSCPANMNYTLFSSSSASTSKEMPGAVDRSNSDSCVQPRPNIPKTQRRHSYSNRFSLLEHVTEEMELLVSEEKEPKANHEV
ncbi:butyrophilin-like protein 9 [Thunnus maccoyii]|uniref:butyrophilin-like protein 9 n=1 Tax=Thunnus maccoyii TaxID=8240 RepID=UPI001C4B819F|nr:butyrophilin-like protein 9 [Thunnus maccoyii]XP_042257688.1 butyrophilin-like protein 9 [Thunnus maccoyii]